MQIIEFPRRPSVTNYITDSTRYSKLSSGNKEDFNKYSLVTSSPTTYERLIDLRTQIGEFLETLKKKMYLGNEEEILNFLLNQSLDIDEIIEPFLFINKITNNNAFFEKSKIFVEKYDDPENEDLFISVKLRQEIYPENFIDEIWALREGFSKQFQYNDWILITTDFKTVRE
jgi:hypothetical protein